MNRKMNIAMMGLMLTLMFSNLALNLQNATIDGQESLSGPKASDIYPGGKPWIVTGDYTVDWEFEMDGNIEVYAHLTIEDCVVNATGSTYIVNVNAGANLTIKNVIIQGYSSGSFRIVFNGDRLFLKNVTFKNMQTNPILSYKPLEVENCTFDGINGEAIIINQQSVNIDDVNITESTFKNIEDEYSIYCSASVIQTLWNWDISNNSFDQAGGMYVKGLMYSKIENNTFSQPETTGVYLINPYHSNVSFNTFAQAITAIEIRSSQNVTVNNNTLTGITLKGISVSFGIDIYVENNTIEVVSGNAIYIYNGDDGGIWVKNCSINSTLVTQKTELINIGEERYLRNNPSRKIFFDNFTTINSKPVLAFYNFSDTTVDLSSFSDISKLIIMNCTNASFIGANVSNGDGAFLSNLLNCTISGITANSNYYAGIQTELLENTTIEDFTVKDNLYCGLDLNGKYLYTFMNKLNTYQNGNITGNRNFGIISRETNNTFFDLSIVNNSQGMLFDYPSEGCVIDSSVFANNSIKGLNFYGSTDMNLSLSNFTNNGETNVQLGYGCYNVNISFCELVKPLEDLNRFNIRSQEGQNNYVHNNHYSDYFGFDDNNDGYGDTHYMINASYGVHENFNDTKPMFVDPDDDNIDDFTEDYYGTNKSNADTDGDGLTDYQEIFLERAFESTKDSYGFILAPSDPLNADSDGDGLDDSIEMLILYSNPNYWDTDGDGFADNIEVAQSSDPTDAADWPGKSNQDEEIEENDNTSPTPVPDKSIKAVPGYPPMVFGVISLLGIGLIAKYQVKGNTHGRKRHYRNVESGGEI